MIKKIILFFVFSVSLFSHELILIVEDNKNNTITVAGEFDTGDSVSGALIKLESLSSGDILFQQRLPESQEIIVEIPKEPYRVVLDGGSGHTLIKAGIAPIEGFKEEVKQNVSNQNKKSSQKQTILTKWDSLTITFFTLCLIAFLLAIYFSNKNTNRILAHLKES
ncbi:hypothetical protein ACNSOS_10315 [Aliarcobacter vitoriensis]|uniref:hypothetical protein n=1 Tax=Aliarcobacter vitoriensis TaxID=2011099 RepID=UPI003AAF4D0F